MDCYNYYRSGANSYLAHHGIKGQKWGIRRYQNEDGSLTEAGKRRYSSMDSEKLRKELTKEIKKQRKKQYDLSKRYNWQSTIGPNSKKALDNWKMANQKHQNTPEFKAFKKKLDSLEKKAEQLDYDEYTKKWDKIWDDYYKTESGKEHKRLSAFSVNKGKGWQQGKAFCESYGKEITKGYLKDLGFNDSGADYVQKILEKDLRGLGM